MTLLGQLRGTLGYNFSHAGLHEGATSLGILDACEYALLVLDLVPKVL